MGTLPRRKWKAWAVLEHDETLHGIQMLGPDESEPLRALIAMGWRAIPVDVTEILE